MQEEEEEEAHEYDLSLLLPTCRDEGITRVLFMTPRSRDDGLLISPQVPAAAADNVFLTSILHLSFLVQSWHHLAKGRSLGCFND